MRMKGLRAIFLVGSGTGWPLQPNATFLLVLTTVCLIGFLLLIHLIRLWCWKTLIINCRRLVPHFMAVIFSPQQPGTCLSAYLWRN